MSLEDIGREIVDAGKYMVLGTADGSGRPWVSPVWYAHANYREFFWVSGNDVEHSRNIAARPDISIVVFDSSQALGTGQAVYMAATAEQVREGEEEPGMEVFNRWGREQGGRPWTLDEVRPPSSIRLYRATVSRHWMLDKSGEGPGHDHRTEVSL
jgi:nitroimidazol reductase NimA-like FMN-containing flavoprotein (pyridoxamine 5'-phosphate oxidase superfamily)